MCSSDLDRLDQLHGLERVASGLRVRVHRLEFVHRSLLTQLEVAKVGDRHKGIDDAVCSLDKLLELSGRHEKEGMGDAPWPPHYKKQEGEPSRVQPSRAKSAPSAGKSRRVSKRPLIEIGRASKKEDALEGLERWKKRHPDVAKLLEPADVLVDAMRGRFTTWTRIRVNLQHVPEEMRPPQEPLDPDENPLQDAWE